MSRRIDIELTSALADGSYTWRAAGAREPRGVLVGSILPAGASVGDEFKVEVDQMIDGIEVLSVVKGREKSDPDLLEFLPSDKPFEAVIETRAKRDRGGGGRDRRDDRGPRGKDGKGRGRDGGRRDGGRDSKSRDSKSRDTKSGDDGREGGRRDGGREGRGSADGGRSRRERPHFDPPPEVPQRPKPKRLRPGKTHRNEVLAALPEDQRPIAEVALQGMAAVRTRLAEENEKLAADGKPVMPESSVIKMAEELLPKLRVADWHDRADAALRQMEHLDLRDLRSVVAASSDSMVARDESTRAVAEELRVALVHKQEDELRLWLEDVDAALGVGRAIRALRLSSQPPKAGVMFPPDLARRLAEAATKSLQPEDSADRWAAVMEAAAFSPVRALIAPTAPPNELNDDLRKTTLRLGPLLPQIATLLGVDVPPNAPKPKPLRPQHRKDNKGRPSKGGGESADRAKRPADKNRAGTGKGKASGKPAGNAAPETKPADTKPADTKPADTKSADTKAAATPEPATPPADTAAAPEPEATPASPEPPVDTATAPEPETTPAIPEPPADTTAAPVPEPVTPEAPADTTAAPAPEPTPATPEPPADTTAAPEPEVMPASPEPATPPADNTPPPDRDDSASEAARPDAPADDAS